MSFRDRCTVLSAHPTLTFLFSYELVQRDIYQQKPIAGCLVCGEQCIDGDEMNTMLFKAKKQMPCNIQEEICW